MVTYVGGVAQNDWFRGGNHIDFGYNAGLEVIRGFDLEHVLETGSNSNGYYRLWTDGFIEQWFRIQGPINNSFVWTYPLAFSDDSTVDADVTFIDILPSVPEAVSVVSTSTISTLYDTQHVQSGDEGCFFRARGY